MKPKPFWPLNHLTVPVGIFFSKSTSRATITRFHSTGRCLWEIARRRIQKGTAADRTFTTYWFRAKNASIRRHPYEVWKTIGSSRPLWGGVYAKNSRAAKCRFWGQQRTCLPQFTFSISPGFHFLSKYA